MEHVEKILDQYERGLGLPTLSGTDDKNEFAKLLGLSRSELKAMGVEERGEAAYLLRQAAFNLQRSTNRESARQKWADQNVRRVITPLLPNCFGYSPEERRKSAVAQDDAAQKFEKIYEYSTLRLERITFLSNKVSEMAREMGELAKSKRGGFE